MNGHTRTLQQNFNTHYYDLFKHLYKSGGGNFDNSRFIPKAGKGTFLSLLLSSVIGFSACTDSNSTQDLAGQKPLALSVGLAGQSARAIIEETTLPEGSEIGLFLTDDGGSTYDGASYANVKYTANGTGASQTWDADADIMLSATSGTLHAYYPYNNAVTSIQAVTVEAASLTDYMYATPVSGLSVSSNEAQVTLNHALTAIKLTLTRGTYSGTGKVSNLSVTSDALATDASLDATTGELSAITGAGTAFAHDTDLTLAESPQSITVTAVPTTATATVTITATVDGLPFAVTTSATAFRQGNMYEYTLTVNNEAMTVAEVNVTPWNSMDNGQLDYEAYDPFKNAIVATYYVDETATASARSTGVEVQLLYSDTFYFNLSSVAKMEVDGVETTPSRTYTFTTPGEHTVKFLCANETVVPQYMFYNCFNLKRFELPETVTTIGERAFYGCWRLDGIVTIPNSVTSIGRYAFYNCNRLEGLDLGSGLQTIGEWAFYQCWALSSIVIPNSVTEIGSYAFYNCTGVTKLELGSGLNKIDTYVFKGCSKLKEITFKAMTRPNYTNVSFSGMASKGVLIIPPGATGYDDWMNTSGSYIGFEDNGWKYREENATPENGVYYSSDGKIAMMGDPDYTGTITIKDGVETIASNAFWGCTGLTSISIPNSVTSIGVYAFTQCSGLTTLELGSGVTEIGEKAFYECTGLQGTLIIPNSVKEIGYASFMKCSGLTGTLTIPNSVTKIGEGAFGYCEGLTGLDLGKGLQSIGKYAFEECSLLSMIVSKAMTAPTISNYSFKEIKSNGTLTIPTGATGYDAWMATDSYYLGYYNWTLQYSDDLITE